MYKRQTEGTIANQTAEAIADITSSGETLRANHLKIIREDPILRSQATLFARRAQLDDPGLRLILNRLNLS